MKKQVYEITKNVISNLFLQNPVVSLAGGTKCVFAVFTNVWVCGITLERSLKEKSLKRCQRTEIKSEQKQEFFGENRK